MSSNLYRSLFFLSRLGLFVLVVWVVSWLLFSLVFFFFFQAEDGIRDTSVTGVQTCALPIYSRPAFRFSRRGGHMSLFATKSIEQITREQLESGEHSLKRVLGPMNLLLLGRSEERRVGKEGRSWWWGGR